MWFSYSSLRLLIISETVLAASWNLTSIAFQTISYASLVYLSFPFDFIYYEIIHPKRVTVIKCNQFLRNKFGEDVHHSFVKDGNLFFSFDSFVNGGKNLQSQILKKGDQKNISAWGVLKSPCHRYFPGGGLLYFLPKKSL